MNVKRQKIRKVTNHQSYAKVENEILEVASALCIEVGNNLYPKKFFDPNNIDVNCESHTTFTNQKWKLISK